MTMNSRMGVGYSSIRVPFVDGYFPQWMWARVVLAMTKTH